MGSTGQRPQKPAQAQNAASFPDLLVFCEGVGAERLAGAVSLLCRPEGFGLEELKAGCGFDTRRSRSNRRFPPRVRFLYLGSKEADSFVIGLGKTDKDPSSGVPHCYYIPYDKGRIPSGDLTAWCSIQVKTGRLLVNCVQAETVMDAYKGRVEEEMLRRSGELSGPQAGDIGRRINSLRSHGVPWAYPDRALLFGVAAVMLARDLGLGEVKFVEDSLSGLSKAACEYAKDSVRHPGINVTSGMPEIF
jgi:hypothetical protein